MQSRDPHLSHDFGDSLSHSSHIVIDLLVAEGRVEFILMTESRPSLRHQVWADGISYITKQQAEVVHLSEVIQWKCREIYANYEEHFYARS